MHPSNDLVLASFSLTFYLLSFSAFLFQFGAKKIFRMTGAIAYEFDGHLPEQLARLIPA